MKKIIERIDYLFIFFLLVLFFLPNFISSCNEYVDFSFDAQNFLVWNYAAFKVSYFNIFYPYGIFFYYKNSNMFAFIAYYIILIGLFIGIFYIFKKLWINKIFSYLSFFSFFTFIYILTGFDVFARYGIAFVGLIIFAVITYKKKKIILESLLFGLFLGFLLSIIPDQGIYLTISITTLLFITFIIRKVKFLNIIKDITILFLGLIFGFLPFFVYVFFSGNLENYLWSLINLIYISEYAKTPFFPGLKTIDNFFSISIFIISVSYISYKLVYKKKILLSDYLMLASCILLFLLEQKNIIRSQDRVITFIPFFIIFIYLSQLYSLKVFKINFYQKIFFLVLVSIIIIFNIGLSPVYAIVKKSSWETASSSSCEKNYLIDAKKNFQTHNKVINFLKTDKIYSFPSDPVFYLLNNQSLPPYLNIYDASFLKAQEKNIEYIKKNEIKFVIYNLDTYSTQDGVPDIVRGNHLFKYIIRNYKPFFTVDNFLILKKEKKEYDYFSVRRYDFLQEKLLQIDLGYIPSIEGYYKNKEFEKFERLNNLENLNKRLKISKVSSENKAILITQKKQTNSKIQLEIISDNGLSQFINILGCNKVRYCIVKLDNLPLFFSKKNLNHVKIKKGDIEKIGISEILPNSSLW